MNYLNDKRIVMTLDAGGTNFVFSALQSGEEIISPIKLPANSSDLDLCLKTIIRGFNLVKQLLPVEPVAISFAFPGPADYKNGIIGDLPNFSSFRGGVALGPMLENIFEIPTFINNDGDLFTYGESVAGILPEINNALKEKGVEKEYKNLFGITLGTGFGGGIVANKNIFSGDNSAGGEIWLMRNFSTPHLIAEEGVSIRAIQRVYSKLAQVKILHTPKDIYKIALGKKPGNKEAAISAFEEMAIVIGESLANAITLFDGPVVIGGGISGASDFIVPRIVDHLNGTIENQKGEKMSRLVSKAYNLEDPVSYESFINWEAKKIKIPFSDKEINYNSDKRIPIGISRLGTSEAICFGAYVFALNSLNRNDKPSVKKKGNKSNLFSPILMNTTLY